MSEKAGYKVFTLKFDDNEIRDEALDILKKLFGADCSFPKDDEFQSLTKDEDPEHLLVLTGEDFPKHLLILIPYKDTLWEERLKVVKEALDLQSIRFDLERYELENDTLTAVPPKQPKDEDVKSLSCQPSKVKTHCRCKSGPW